MADWTMARVQDRLELAADVFAQLPGVKPRAISTLGPSTSTASPITSAKSRR